MSPGKSSPFLAVLVSNPTLAPHEMTMGEALDRAALRHLADAYCHAVDRRDYALLLSLYHEDAIDDHAPYFTGLAADFVAWLPSMMANWGMTMHTISNALYLIDGHKAEGILSTKAYHRTVDGARAFIGYGRYLDRYEKRDGGWKFSHRSLALDYSEFLDVAGAADAGAEGAALGQAGERDPCYGTLPLFKADRLTRAS